MSGILFNKSTDLAGIRRFYSEQIGMKVWLTQAECVILKHGNLLLGFCQREVTDSGGLITFFYSTRAEVDAIYTKLADRAEGKPKRNDRYDIYHFYARDPEGRPIEFQTFEHPCEPYLDGEEMLRTRRSIRRFTDRDVPESLLARILEDCAHAPSSRDTQPWLFVPIRDRARLERLAAVRGDSSAPIARAPMAVAIVTDPERTGRAIEDACIAAYHLILVAWSHGLGTCWIGGMDRGEVKEILGIPCEYVLATVTPLGYPAALPEMSPRRPIRRHP